MDGLRPQRIKATKSKRIEPLVTPEARSFREATGKLDNWTNHRRITDYLSKDPADVDRGEEMDEQKRPKCYGSAKVEIKDGVLNADCLRCGLEGPCWDDFEARRAYAEGVLYHFGEARLEEDDEEAEDTDKHGNRIFEVCLRGCPMGYTEAQIRDGLCAEMCEDALEEEAGEQ